MGTGVFDANGILRVGPDLEGASLFTVTAPINEGDQPFAAEVSDFVVVGDLADDLAVVLPTANLTPGDQVAVKLMGTVAGGKNVTVDPGANQIDGSSGATLSVQYQQLYVVWVSPTLGWAILESGEGVAEVFSVFQATGNVLPNATAIGDDIDLGVGTFNAASAVLSTFVFASEQIQTGKYFAFKQATAPADGLLDPSQALFWLDPTNGAGVLHIKAKTADGTVVGAAIPLA